MAEAGDGLGRDPIGHPLTYPGALPEGSGLLDGDRFRPLIAPPGDETPPGEWRLDGATTLDGALRTAARPALADRHPVVAVGSNGSPAQLHRKFAGRADLRVPLIHATVRGLLPGVSAHVSRPGYVPAAPVLAPGAVARLPVVWLDETQLSVLDATEPNYRRLPVPDAVAVAGDGRRPELYAGRHGCLVDRRGEPFALTAQADLLGALLADLPELGRLTGATGPGDFVARVRRDPELRERVRLLWRREGRAVRQPELGLIGEPE
ncbi:hypothetical protein [Actinomadura sp. DC4]|uniref:hypothetical protein n=1 Tax=Actinomadura sp. DC4 TaxID=3055069 RepID=UPI0025B08584|nr:hypothetical protein [Actinomadura sp. DC4]MDN3355312.1 hypothetical protein [Actinomadura sp. DC4]